MYKMKIVASNEESFYKAIDQAELLFKMRTSSRIKEFEKLNKETKTLRNINLLTARSGFGIPVCDNDNSEEEEETITTSDICLTSVPEDTRTLENKIQQTTSSSKDEKQNSSTLDYEPHEDIEALNNERTVTALPLFETPPHVFILSPEEEDLILNAIYQASDVSFSQGKIVAQDAYAYILAAKNGNRPLPVSEYWFYLFLYHHMDELFKRYPYWLYDLEELTLSRKSSQLVGSTSSASKDRHIMHQQQLIKLMSMP